MRIFELKRDVHDTLLSHLDSVQNLDQSSTFTRLGNGVLPLRGHISGSFNIQVDNGHSSIPALLQISNCVNRRESNVIENSFYNLPL